MQQGRAVGSFAKLRWTEKWHIYGLKGFPEVIETVYPQAIVQLCIVHMVRNSLNYVGWNKRKEVAADLRLVYSATTIDAAEQALFGTHQHR